MAHRDAGRYSGKQAPGTQLDANLADTIRARCPDDMLACGTAERISKDVRTEMSEVGVAADLLEMKIGRCQLGLFGWGSKPNHGKDIVAAESVTADMRNALVETAHNGKVTCEALWRIADQLGVGRKEVSAACDALGFKIGACQLGAF